MNTQSYAIYTILIKLGGSLALPYYQRCICSIIYRYRTAYNTPHINIYDFS